MALTKQEFRLACLKEGFLLVGFLLVSVNRGLDWLVLKDALHMPP